MVNYLIRKRAIEENKLVFILRTAPMAVPVAIPYIKLSRAHGYRGKFRKSSTTLILFTNISFPNTEIGHATITFIASFSSGLTDPGSDGSDCEPEDGSETIVFPRYSWS
jgi:hypothetical protein